MNQIDQPEAIGPDPVTSGDNGGTAGTRPLGESQQDSVLGSGRLSPADKVALSYLTIVAILILISHDRIEFWWLLVPAHAIAIAIVLVMARMRLPECPDEIGPDSSRPVSALSVARSWYPLILIPLSYKELGYVIPLIHPYDFDRELALIDQRMFGVDPVTWLDLLNYPAVSLVMQLSYLTYYVMPILLGIVLWQGRRFREFQFFLFVILLGFSVSYLGYIAVPAIGPRFFLKPDSVRPFDGPGVAAIRSFLDRMEGVTRDCFPSGHTELTLLVLFCAHRFHKKTFYILVPAGLALIFSTVYLRYHYVIDVIAGAATAFAIALVADWLYKAAGGASVATRNPSS